MTNQEKKNPAVGAAGSNDNQNVHPHIVSDNPHPRQRWRGNPALKPISMSPKLVRYFEAMAKGECNDNNK